jgi:hypothetical protein
LPLCWLWLLLVVLAARPSLRLNPLPPKKLPSRKPRPLKMLRLLKKKVLLLKRVPKKLLPPKKKLRPRRQRLRSKRQAKILNHEKSRANALLFFHPAFSRVPDLQLVIQHQRLLLAGDEFLHAVDTAHL